MSAICGTARNHHGGWSPLINGIAIWYFLYSHHFSLLSSIYKSFFTPLSFQAICLYSSPALSLLASAVSLYSFLAPSLLLILSAGSLVTI